VDFLRPAGEKRNQFQQIIAHADDPPRPGSRMP
jgi:hypothetical protein